MYEGTTTSVEQGAPMTKLTKTRTVLHAHGWAPSPGDTERAQTHRMVYLAEKVGEPDNHARLTELRLDPDVYEDMGRPAVVTVTIEPGEYGYLEVRGRALDRWAAERGRVARQMNGSTYEIEMQPRVRVVWEGSPSEARSIAMAIEKGVMGTGVEFCLSQTFNEAADKGYARDRELDREAAGSVSGEGHDKE